MCVCVCVWWEGLVCQHRHTGGVVVKMVDIMVSEEVGRRQEEKATVSALMLVSHWSVHVCLPTVYLCSAQVSEENVSLFKQPSVSFHPSGPYFPGIVF